MPNEPGATALTVGLAERSYPIHIGSGVLDRAGLLLKGVASRRFVVVTNPVVAAYHLERLRAALAASGATVEVLVVPEGEAHKSWQALQDIVTRLIELGAERSTTLVALGGGVVGDLAGFAAAIYQRGMPLVQIPTTLLAQVDSSVGGKTAINHPLGKNMIGAFHQPRAVLIDIDCLRTLPDRELSAGVAEVVKCGAIRDAQFFAWLERNIAPLLARDSAALAHAIRASCEIKAAIVAADERETGERALLNFGHTFGHAIETETGYGAWLHGESVAAGMMLAARLSERWRGLRPDDVGRIGALLAQARLPTLPPPISFSRWLELLRRDKKVAAGVLRFVLLTKIGHAVVADDVPERVLHDLLH